MIEEGAAAAAAPAKAEAPKAEAPKAAAPKPRPPLRPPRPRRPRAAAATGELPPGARFTAATEGIDPAQVEGTGRRGAVTKEDLVNYAKSGGAVAASARPEQRVPMTRMRARIAERLMQSKNSIAMLTSFNEVNLAQGHGDAQGARRSSSRRPTASSSAS